MSAAILKDAQSSSQASTTRVDSAELGETLVEIRDLEKRFSLSGDFLEQLTFEKGRLRRKQEYVHAINGVTLDVKRGGGTVRGRGIRLWQVDGRTYRDGASQAQRWRDTF